MHDPLLHLGQLLETNKFWAVYNQWRGKSLSTGTCTCSLYSRTCRLGRSCQDCKKKHVPKIWFTIRWIVTGLDILFQSHCNRDWSSCDGMIILRTFSIGNAGLVQDCKTKYNPRTILQCILNSKGSNYNAFNCYHLDPGNLRSFGLIQNSHTIWLDCKIWFSRLWPMWIF